MTSGTNLVDPFINNLSRRCLEDTCRADKGAEACRFLGMCGPFPVCMKLFRAGEPIAGDLRTGEYPEGGYCKGEKLMNLRF